MILRNRCDDSKIGLKDFRLFLIDFGLLKSLDSKSNNLEMSLANELWKSLTRYEPSDPNYINSKHLKSMLKAIFGLLNIQKSFQEFEIGDSVRVERKRMGSVPTLQAKPQHVMGPLNPRTQMS